MLSAGSIELKLGDQHCDELLGHLVAHHVGGREAVGGGFVIRIAQLDHRLDRLELD